VRYFYTKLVIVLVVIMIMSGCGWWSKGSIGTATPEGLYQRGYEYYHNGKYKKAIEAFRRVSEEYPLSKLAIMAELGVADSYYSDEKYAEAEASYEDFITLHPTNENIPYVMYQIGMCHYNEMSGIDRDQTETMRAKESFERLMTRFPSSKFTIMAEKKLHDVRKQLGEHEFYVGEFYFKIKEYKAALMRFEFAAQEYANLGMDYKLNYFINETKRRIAEEVPEEE